MTASLANKTALVTGSSRGIGRAIARQIAAEGALVAVHYGANRAAADECVRLIAEAGGQAFAVQAELTRLADIRRLFADLDAELTRRTGSNGLDIVVSNAGADAEIGFEDTTEDLFDRLIAINVKAPFFVFQEAMGRIRDGGRMINVSSVVARGAQAGRPVYAASKVAANSLVLSLAARMGPRGITVNTVAPGATRTEMSAHILDDEAKGPFIKQATALRRFADVDDVADAVSLLISPQGGWITGQTIEATGGLWL